MTISPFTRRLKAALPPRLGAMLALTSFLLLGAGAESTRAAVCLSCDPVTQDFYFKFNAVLTGGAISGGWRGQARP